MFTSISLFLMLVLAKAQALDHTHDPNRQSWVDSANDPTSEFPIQNLPYGVFRESHSLEEPRIGVAIGQYVLDLKGAVAEGFLDDLPASTCKALSARHLNEFMSLGRAEWIKARRAISQILDKDDIGLRCNLTMRKKLLIPLSAVDMLLPVDIGDYTDFYASIYHASNIGTMLRPSNPLMPNYKHMPIGYHGRASSVVVSGTPIHWPKGQLLVKDEQPRLGFSESLDYELELGMFIGAGNPLGSPIGIAEAENHIFGFVLLNDWSARDIQKWEYQPLGPFNSKNFSTSISPWIVTFEALAPFRINPKERGEGDVQLLEYLRPIDGVLFDVIAEAYIDSVKMRVSLMPPLLITQANVSDLYWSFDQMICHHTVTGCNLRPGDLLGSGTLSGPTKTALGCLFERVALNMGPLPLPDGTARKFLESGDEIVLKAYAEKADYPRIGFGECRGVVEKRF